MLLLFGTDLLFIYFPVKGTESMYVSSRSDLKYSRMLVACGIGLQKLRVHNWGVDNSFKLSGLAELRGKERICGRWRGLCRV